MQTFETYRQFLGACTERTASSHRPPAGPFFWTCETCGKCAPHDEGYGVNPTEPSMHCYRCCDDRERAELLDRSRPFNAYLHNINNSGLREVTTWSGGKLGEVYSLTHSRSGFGWGWIARFHVRDVHGQWWQGRGAGDGMVCTLRPMKQPAYAKRWGQA